MLARPPDYVNHDIAGEKQGGIGKHAGRAVAPSAIHAGQRDTVLVIMQIMNTPSEPLYDRIRQRYIEHNVPWDHVLPPPEVLAFAASHAPGRMLDLGCGYGRACLHLSSLGWTCVGVDFVPEAIEGARARIDAAGLADRVTFHRADVSELGFLNEPYDFILDVGCLHSQPEAVCNRYAGHVARLCRPGGLYLLFAHLGDGSETDQGRWITQTRLDSLFVPNFVIERFELGTTTVADETWRSGWFWMRRGESA